MKIFEERGYKYQKHISTGGEGEVHLIKSVDKKFIAKIVSQIDADSIKILNDISSMNIPNIPKIHEIFNYKDKTVIIRDYVEGNTLYDEIKKNKNLSYKRAKEIIIKVCDTLSAFHNVKPNPIIYRDLKPENIIITPDGDVRLIDFGIIRYHKQGQTRDTVLAGTNGYTAPEVMAGMQSDRRSDVYSVGLLFYEMLTGRNLLEPPYQIRPVKEVNEFLPNYIDRIIEKATDISKVNRYATIDDFVYDLNNPNEGKKNKKGKIALPILIVSMLCIGAIIYVLFNNFFKNEAQALLNIDFEDETYKDYVKLFGEKIDYGDIVDVNIEDMVSDGIYNMQYETRMNFNLNSGDIYHIRLKPGEAEEDGMLFILTLCPIANIEGLKTYCINFENHQLIASQVRNNYGYYPGTASGFPIIPGGIWLDVVVWYEDENNTIRYFVADTESQNKIAYGGAKMREEWWDYSYNIDYDFYFEVWEGEMGKTVPVTQVDFIKYTNASIKCYLDENIPAYRSSKETIDEFIDSELPLVSQDDYTQHGY